MRFIQVMSPVQKPKPGDDPAKPTLQRLICPTNVTQVSRSDHNGAYIYLVFISHPVHVQEPPEQVEAILAKALNSDYEHPIMGFNHIPQDLRLYLQSHAPFPFGVEPTPKPSDHT